MSGRPGFVSQDSLFLSLSSHPNDQHQQPQQPHQQQQHDPYSNEDPDEGTLSGQDPYDHKSSLREPLLAPSVLNPPTVPKDKFHLAQGIFFLIGVGMLFPWNVFITATSFFELKFKGSPFFDNFESWFSIAYNIANILTLLFVMRIIEKFSTSFRVYSSLIPSLLIFVAITALVMVEIPPTAFFGFIMVCVVLSGIAVGFLQNGIFTLSAKFPFAYTAATMNGQGVAGLAVSLSQILTTLAGTGAEESEEAIELSAILYFSVSVLVLFLSILGYVVLRRLPVFKYYHKGKRDREQAEVSGGIPTKEYVDLTWRGQLAILKVIAAPSFAVCYNFLVTLAIFPTIIAAVASVSAENSESRIFHDIFVPFAFLLFNVGDLAGRVSAGLLPLVRPSWLPAASLLRTIFFFLFLCSNVVLRDPNGEIIETSLPVFFGNDYVYWVFILLFAASNGYLASVCMITGPNMVDPKEKEKAGSLMITSLVLGLSLGSFSSFGLRAILCQCNPFSA